MNNWTLAGIIALIIIVCAGTIIKFYTHSRIKEYDGTYDIKDPDENAPGEDVLKEKDIDENAPGEDGQEEIKE